MAEPPAPIAIIGMGCRLPGGSDSPEKLWNMLSEGRSGWREIPEGRWNKDSFYHPHLEAREAINVKGLYFLEQDIAAFDARFFGIHPHEAHCLDPQQRILIETTYEAIENAGITLQAIKGTDTSVHVGAYATDFERMGYKDLSRIPKLHMIGSGIAILSNRLSYVFDLKGASSTVDTGCSGSMVALHQACQGLRNRESSMAIVAGTQLVLTPDQIIPMSMVGMTNPDGRCYVFDSRGSGYARGEGVVSFVLKRLDDAIQDDDNIHAVIRNTGLNQDGKTAGISLPNPIAQAALMRSVYKSAGLSPRDTGYVEAHGTGTVAGDIAEISSIAKVFCGDIDRKDEIFVGSIKSNIGHLEASSGVAGLIKAVLILKNNTIPPNIDFEKPKESLHLEERNVKIPTQMTPLPSTGIPRVSVNSFGYGGTNAHVILEAAPMSVHPGGTPESPESTSSYEMDFEQAVQDALENSTSSSDDAANETSGSDVSTEPTPVDSLTNSTIEISHPKKISSQEEPATTVAISHELQTPVDILPHSELIVLSAKSETSLRAVINNIQGWATSHKDDTNLHDLAYTLSSRRTHHQFRYSTIASSYEDLIASLESPSPRITKSSTTFRNIFIFTGQGAQWFAMGRELIVANPVFQASMLKSDEVLSRLGATWSLIEELSKDEASSRVSEAEISQPSTTAVQIALVGLLASIGVKPEIVLGHSSGEIVAAYAAGALDHEAALEVSYRRGFMSQACRRVIPGKGAMIAVGLGEEDVMQYINKTTSGVIAVACVNSPISTTISGDESAIDELHNLLQAERIFNRKLKIDTAYHSHHMKMVADDYLKSIAHITSKPLDPDVKFISSVTSSEKTSGFDAQYWVDNLVSKVRFDSALDLICQRELAVSRMGDELPLSLIIEIGPHSALAGPVRQILKPIEGFKSMYLPTLVRGQSGVASVLETAGKLFESGYNVLLDSVLVMNGSEPSSTVGSLPPYPWDHSQSYFIESNLSKQHRFRAHAPHDLLGLRVVGTTIHEPTWKHVISLESLPWLRDHVVDGFMIYPGAAYLCMAIEAIRQISIDRKMTATMSKILMKNISFSKAIVIPDQRPDGLTPDVEIQLTLRPERNLNDHTWETFRILSQSADNAWSEHCSGSIMVEWANKIDEVEGWREQEMTIEKQLSTLLSMKDECDLEFDGEQLYKDFASNGNVFGPTFSNVNSAQIGAHIGIANVTIPDVGKVMPAGHMQPHLIHPATFDAISHLGMPLYRRSCSSGPVMPTGMDEVIINMNVGNKAGSKWVVATRMNSEGPRSALMNTMVFQENDDLSLSPIITIQSGSLRGVGEATADETNLPFNRKMSYRMNWQPDVDSLAPSTTSALGKVQRDDGLSTLPPNEEMALHELAAAIYIRRALTALGGEDPASMKPHHVELLAWLRRFDVSETSKNILEEHSDLAAEVWLQRSLDAGVEGQMLARIGQALPSILSGETDSLALMLEDDLLARFYSTGLIVPNYLQMVEYLKLLAFKQPHMTILEVGAGTGGATLPLIQSLDREEGLLLHNYIYTDISAGFFEQAKTLLQNWTDYIEFKTLDVSKDIIAQGFKEGSVDLVIASNVLHATSELDATVENVRKLMKPGGRMVLIELTRLTAAINVIFGTLAGWWEASDGREDCPLLTLEKWNMTLTRNGFGGVEIAVPDHEGHTARSFMIVSKTVNVQPTDVLLPAVSVIAGTNPGLQSFATTMVSSLLAAGYQSSLTELESRATEAETVYIVLDDATEPLLVGPAQERYQEIVNLVTKEKQVIWVSCQDSHSPTSDPAKGLVTGLARVVRRENEGMRFVTLDIQQDISPAGPVIAAVLDVLARTFSPSYTDISDEDEYVFKNDEILIPRVAADVRFDEWVQSSIYAQKLETGLFHQPERPLKLEVETPGLLNSLRFVDDESPSKELDPDFLELEARAHGINFKDVFIAMGQMIPGVKMAGECAGIVTKVGSNLTEKFSIGDRVCGIGSEPFCSHPRVYGNFSHRIPDSMSFAVGASIPVIFTTAYYCLVEAARLQRGQTILIHAASGGVGQAAILLAQNIGAKIFCTVGSTAKRQLLMDRFNIPAEHIFSSRLRTFKQGVLRLTDGKGVDVVLNSLAGEWLHDSFAVLAPLGTFVEIGKSDIYRKNQISMIPFDRNVTFAAVDLTVLGAHRPKEMRLRLGKVLSMFDEGILTPVEPISTYPMTDIEEAFRLIQSRKNTGKVVLTCEPDVKVKVLSPRPAPLRLEAQGTYIIAGGLGDLGRRIAKFMAAHGAGHVVTLSRRKLKPEVQAAFEEELLGMGAKLHIVACDITDKASVENAAEYCKQNTPPVKGVVHGGMVLRDHPFEHMDLKDYLTAVKPKVHGTRNLDDAFGSDSLEFFIMLSSITSILGKTGQANYSVGNAYQDAFAQSKASSKCRYISLNLGAVDGSDAITSLSSAQQEFMRQGSVLMSFDEVFKVVEYSMGAQARQDNLVQLILGFDRKSMEAVHDSYALANPIFSQIPYLEEKEAVAEQASMDVDKLLQNAQTIDEVHNIVVRAIVERFALFTARPVEDISPSTSLEQFGLDSLVAIELKNWLVRTFQVAVQTSEVVDATSILALGKLVASRSKLVTEELGGIKHTAVVELAPTSTVIVPNHPFHCCRGSKELPKLPLLDLESLFRFYLENRKIFVAEEDFASLVRDAAEFQKQSVGQTLYNRLRSRYEDPSIDNWIDEFYVKSCYLDRRYPLAPFSNFMAIHPVGKTQHSQAERAALVTSVAFRCKLELDADLWEPMTYMGTSNCTDLWDWLFNTVRIPSEPADFMQKHPGNDYIAVLHCGQVFQVTLKTGDEVTSFAALNRAFESILSREDQEESWLSILTADNRDAWAKNREILIYHDKMNEKCIQMIEAAVFLISFDESSPEGPEQRVRHLILNDGFNRWNDKSIAFVICKNAASGTYVEHTMIDAMTLTRMQTAICEAISVYDPSTMNKQAEDSAIVKAFPLSPTPALETRILEIRSRFLEDTAKVEYADVILPHFGKDFLLKRGLPIKGVFDLLIQVACFYFFGRNIPTWEAVSMSQYHRGRPDIVQVVSPIVAKFCSRAEDDSLSPTEKFQSLLEAAKDHNTTIKNASAGQCYQRTFVALEMSLKEGEDVPAFFKNPAFVGSLEPDFMFSNTDGLSPESAFVLGDPSRFWMTYYVTEIGAHFSVVGGDGRAKKFGDCLNRASARFKAIFDSA
ncbi:related to polyketide synthase [Phialocephala subalpina]|uniref:Related to polyketide synthase n=1 Tax=Phialocephala subalpina TaxID=576137 RepID=A0A1L7X8V9_9HELO|nr:related to polyketide synthase [Phialocephala subalpina]